MNSQRAKGLLLAALMFVASGLAVALRPTARLADQGPTISLETMVPTEIGQWRVDSGVVPLAPNPQQQALLNKLYNQTLSRTYIDPKGYRVMLSIAYGGDQSDAMQVHKPEVCYTAQGFQVRKDQRGELAMPGGSLPVKRLLAVQGLRSEPITYWVTVGDRATPVGFQHKLAQLAYGLTGKVPDGMLVRVSSIDTDEQRAYGLLDAFLKDMLAAMTPADRARIAGRLGA